MDTFEFKDTPVKGVWEIGRLDPFPVNQYDGSRKLDQDSDHPANLRALIEFLGANSWRRFSVANPGAFQGSIGWHRDDLGGLTALIACIGTKRGEGTWFRTSDGGHFASPAWVVYLIDGQIEHASPADHAAFIRVMWRWQMTPDIPRPDWLPASIKTAKKVATKTKVARIKEVFKDDAARRGELKFGKE